MLNLSDQKQSALIDRYRNILAMPAGSNLDQLTARFCCIADQKHPHFIQDSPHSDAERQRATVEFNALNTAYKSMCARLPFPIRPARTICLQYNH